MQTQADITIEQLFSDDKVVRANAIAQLKKNFHESVTQGAGFFTPYRSVTDFGSTLMAPFGSALGCSLFIGLAAITASIAALTAACSLVLAGGAVLFGRSQFASSALGISATTALIAGMATLVAAATALIVAIVVPLEIVAIATRSLATVGSGVGNLFSGCISVAKETEEPRMTCCSM